MKSCNAERMKISHGLSRISTRALAIHHRIIRRQVHRSSRQLGKLEGVVFYFGDARSAPRRFPPHASSRFKPLFAPFPSTPTLSSLFFFFFLLLFVELVRQCNRVRKSTTNEPREKTALSENIFLFRSNVQIFFPNVNNIILKKYLLDKHRLEKKSLRFFFTGKKVR